MRLTTGTIYTDKLLTGQREMAGLGIYHYGARFYSPKLGRFLSADTIVPNPYNPQDLNRFSYVRNNPLRYTDPTGHTVACEPGDDCDRTPLKPAPPPSPAPHPHPDPDPEPDPDPVPDPNPDPIPGGGGTGGDCSLYDPSCANVSGQVLSDYLRNVFDPYQDVLGVAQVVVPIVGGITLSACLVGMVSACIWTVVAVAVEIELVLEANEAGQISDQLYGELGQLAPNDTTTVSLTTNPDATFFELSTSNVWYGTDVDMPINATMLSLAVDDWRTGDYIFP